MKNKILVVLNEFRANVSDDSNFDHYAIEESLFNDLAEAIAKLKDNGDDQSKLKAFAVWLQKNAWDEMERDFEDFVGEYLEAKLKDNGDVSVSDDEIKKYASDTAQNYTDYEGEQIEIFETLTEGAKWMRAKLKDNGVGGGFVCPECNGVNMQESNKREVWCNDCEKNYREDACFT